MNTEKKKVLFLFTFSLITVPWSMKQSEGMILIVSCRDLAIVGLGSIGGASIAGSGGVTIFHRYGALVASKGLGLVCFQESVSSLAEGLKF